MVIDAGLGSSPSSRVRGVPSNDVERREGSPGEAVTKEDLYFSGYELSLVAIYPECSVQLLKINAVNIYNKVLKFDMRITLIKCSV